MDPIEKKPLYHFYPGSEILSLGTVGCNFGCSFCQNWEISMTRDIEECGRVKHLSPADVVAQCERSGCGLIAFTYNEPTVWFEYGLDIMRLARQRGIKSVYVSNGFMSRECCEVLVDHVSAANIDLKCFSDEGYRKTMGGRLQPVLDNIRFLFEKNVSVEVTTLVIPDFNDSDAELGQIAGFLASVSRDLPWHVSAFHPDYQMQDRGRTPAATLERAYQIGKAAGLKHIYTGNVANARSDLICDCGEVVIARDYRAVKKHHMKNGCCGKCGSKIYGQF